nr:unnamed protein product [Digitaria exilis]
MRCSPSPIVRGTYTCTQAERRQLVVATDEAAGSGEDVLRSRGTDGHSDASGLVEARVIGSVGVHGAGAGSLRRRDKKPRSTTAHARVLAQTGGGRRGAQ